MRSISRPRWRNGRRSSPIASGWRSARGAERQWRKLSYGEAKRTVDALTQGLLDLGARAGPPRRDPVGQFDRACADDAGGDAGAVSGGAGVAGLFADEPGSRQTEISVRPDQAGAGDGAGRPDLREGAEGARSRRRHGRPCRASLRRHQEHRLCRSRGDASDEDCRGSRSRRSRRIPSANCCSPRARPGCPRRSSTPKR